MKLIVAKALTVVFITGFMYVFVASQVLRRFIDPEKVRNLRDASEVFRPRTPPPEILTSFGVKIWWSRWIVLILALGALGGSYVLFNSSP